jgi:heme exporter protein B
MIGVFIFTAIMEAFLLVLFAILYNLNLVPVLFPLVLIVFLGTLGFSIIGTILSAISARTRARDVMLSILVFPISVPLVIASVKATGKILAGKSIHTIYPWLKILTAYDLVFLLVAYFTFEFVMEE